MPETNNTIVEYLRRSSGIITEEEFTAKKKQLMGI